jgi:hypothetical protein
MRKLMTICATLGMLSGLAMADTWTGTLMDAHCASRHSNEACYARRSSGRFVINVNGKAYHLDGSTNQNVRSSLLEMKGLHRDTPLTATITGRLRSNGRIHGHTIAVQ